MISINEIKVGVNCNINPTVQFYGICEDFEIGDNVRIDAFCILSGKIKIGSFVHIAAGSYLFGSGGITLDDYVGLSSRVSVYSVTDDYSSGFLTNPTVPDEFKNVKKAAVHFKKHTIVGSGSVIMPGVITGVGSSVGSLTLIRRSIPDYTVVAGNPAIVIGKRDKDKLTELEHLHKKHKG